MRARAIIIGESYATVDEVWRAGRAHIYNTDGEHLQTLQSPTLKSDGEFGCSVSIDGDRVVVGERFADVNPDQYEGRAYVFDVDGTLLQNLTAVHPNLRGAFGYEVEIDGEYIVVGEPWAPSGDLGQVGLVHLFKLGLPVEVQEPVEEVTSHQPEADSEPSGGIPGFPIASILLVLLLMSLLLKPKTTKL